MSTKVNFSECALEFVKGNWHEICSAWEFLRLNLKTDPETALREEMDVFWKPYFFFGAKC